MYTWNSNKHGIVEKKYKLKTEKIDLTSFTRAI